MISLLKKEFFFLICWDQTPIKIKKKKIDSFKCVSYLLSTERLNLQQFNIHCKVFK